MAEGFLWEDVEHVCEECGSHDWHANRFFDNDRKIWLNDDIAQWCHDCEREVGIIPQTEYEDEADNPEPGKTYKLLDENNGTVSEWTLPEILAEINKDRSDGWTDYNCSDWREGLEQFTCYSLVNDND